jgi:hypothetical protein
VADILFRDFMAAFAMVPQTFEEYDRHLTDSVVDDAILRGRVVAEYQESVMKRSAKKAVRKKFMGYQVNVINSMVWLSEMGHELAKDSCDFSLLWFYNHAERVHEISLRTIHDNIDLVWHTVFSSSFSLHCSLPLPRSLVVVGTQKQLDSAGLRISKHSSH